MKKILLGTVALAALGLAAPAIAADLPAKAPIYTKAPVLATIYNWTGFYVGVDAGYGWGRYTQFGAGDGPGVNPSGFVFGGHVGYNYQMNNIVLGVEADISTGPRGSVPAGTAGPVYSCVTGPCIVNIDWFGTVRGRVGFAANNLLFYGTGGLAYGHAAGGIDNSTYMGGSTKTGWTAGAGVEYGISPNFSVRAEYLHVDLGRLDFGLTGALVQYSARGSFDIVRAGLTYRFGGPVVAKY